MQELPVLTKIGRQILYVCVYELFDEYQFGSGIRPHMIDAYADKYPKLNKLPKNVLVNCILYLQDVGLVYNVETTIHGELYSFCLTHKGFHYFELEKSLKSQYRTAILRDSILLPILVSVIASLLTLALSM